MVWRKFHLPWGGAACEANMQEMQDMLRFVRARLLPKVLVWP